MVTKIKTISPIIQTGKGDVRNYDALNKLNKRIQRAIDDAVRASITETFFLGYFVDGGYAGVQGNELQFQSPIDKYQYKQSQVKYIWSLFSTRTADPTNPDGTTFVNGQKTFPQPAALSGGSGTIIYMNFVVNQIDGSVTTQVNYYDGVETPTNDGLLAVIAVCQRSLT